MTRKPRHAEHLRDRHHDLEPDAHHRAPDGSAEDEHRESLDKRRLARRRFLKATGAVIVGAGLAGCEMDVAPALVRHPAQPQVPHPAPRFVPQGARTVRGQYPAVPDTPTAPPPPGELRFFTLQEAQTVEAVTARILPGTPDDPGAREAGVVYYIDTVLAYENGFAQAVYRQPPFAEVYAGSTPPTGGSDGFDVVWVAEDQVERYGYQSILTPRDVYRSGLAGLDRTAEQRFGAPFVALGEAQQDEIVAAMLAGEAEGFDDPSGEAFFHVLRRHTSEGMFSDPVYGGNRGMVGWLLIGYPGAQRAYTESDIRAESSDRQPQSIVDMNHFHPGEDANPHVILPVSGSRMQGE